MAASECVEGHLERVNRGFAPWRRCAGDGLERVGDPRLGLLEELARRLEGSPRLEQRETQPSEGFESAWNRADLEECCGAKLVAHCEYGGPRTDAERALQIERVRLRSGRGLLERLERVTRARGNRSRLEQPYRATALFEQRTASVDGLAVQCERAGADASSEQVRSRRGLSRFDVEDDLTRARLVGQELRPVDCAAAVGEVPFIVLPALNFAGCEPEGDREASGRHRLSFCFS